MEREFRNLNSEDYVRICREDIESEAIIADCLESGFRAINHLLAFDPKGAAGDVQNICKLFETAADDHKTSLAQMQLDLTPEPEEEDGTQ